MYSRLGGESTSHRSGPDPVLLSCSRRESAGINLSRRYKDALAVLAVLAINYQPATPPSPRKSWAAEGSAGRKQREFSLFHRCFRRFRCSCGLDTAPCRRDHRSVSLMRRSMVFPHYTTNTHYCQFDTLHDSVNVTNPELAG